MEDHTEVLTTLETSDGNKARNMRRAIMSTGTRRSISGGGGNGGKTSGNTRSEIANTTRRRMDVTLKYPTIQYSPNAVSPLLHFLRTPHHTPSTTTIGLHIRPSLLPYRDPSLSVRSPPSVL
uniref:Uncharacterized protein n=1 Tax=Nelumbo nucifera TaxID=4432 RepID=A0A822YDE4_NELNU|nr:TPA_asm: hypothetical protein HUJ06_030777 [Nelumbo nucifera]